MEGGVGSDDPKYSNDDQTDSGLSILSISDALHLHSGRLKVQGMISSISPLYKMIDQISVKCPSCDTITPLEVGKPVFAFDEKKGLKKCPSCEESILVFEYSFVNAVVIELMDSDTFSDLERLSVILFDDDTKNILVGEKVIVTGEIHIIQSGLTKNRTKLYPCLYSESIEYESSHDLILTEIDKKAIRRFTQLKGDKIMDELVKMVAPSVIGYDDVKEGLLLAASSTGDDLNEIRQGKPRSRINVLLAGEPGNAKSTLSRASIRLVPSSRYETCQNASGKSITAIIVKENGEREFLRLGPVPLARNAICALNELGNMPFEDQAHILDVMEEGEFTITKYAINAKIPSPTVIIASSNPTTSYWKDNEKMSIDELPISKTLLDRFDLLFTFRTTRDEKAIRRYAYQKSELIGGTRRIPDYHSYLVRHVLYSKEFDPYLSHEAMIMLAEYYIRITRKSGSPRILETLHRVAKARARLKLKMVVDAQDANETMQFYNIILLQQAEVAAVSSNPRHTTFDECLRTLEESPVPIVFEEIIEIACRRNEYVKTYVGSRFKLQENKKLRSIADMLLNHHSVSCIKQKPLVLKWYQNETKGKTRTGSDVDGTNDPYDQYAPKIYPRNNSHHHDHFEEENSKTKANSIQGEMNAENKPGSYRAYWSYMFGDSDQKEQLIFTCNYCSTATFNDQEEYEKHSVQKHPGKPAYPGAADIQKLEQEQKLK